MKRNRSTFEKWFSWGRHKRRAGAKALSSLIPTDFKFQQSEILSGDEVVYTHGSVRDLEEHFNNLKAEFAGQSELCYTHAKIIVLIRRLAETKKHFELFVRLWAEEERFLLQNLNIRWLIAAADTFADHSDDDAIKSLSVACACLFYTVKMQESERFITNANQCKDDKRKLDKLKADERIVLFDGTDVFAYGISDALRNMRWRLDRIAKLNVAGEILLEIFKRLQKFDTVYKRAKDRHTNNRTKWW